MSTLRWALTALLLGAAGLDVRAAAPPPETLEQRASKALEDLSEAVEPQLRKALEGKPSLEARRRIERLLKQVRGERLSPSRQRRRAVSAIEVLERIGNAEARGVLAALARGAPTAALTVDARGALERLVRVKDS